MVSDRATPHGSHDRSIDNAEKLSVESAGATLAAARPMTHMRYAVLAMILLLATVAYADRAVLSIAGPALAKAFHLSTVNLGYVLSAFSWAYVIGQIPGGLVLDRLGTKTLYGISLVLWSLATMLVGVIGKVTTDVSVALALLFALRFVVGFVEAPSFPANARVAVMWFPKQERGLATALFASASYFAVAIFSPFAGWLVATFGWPAPFFTLGLIGLASAGVWYRVMHEPRKHPRLSPAELDYIINGGAMIDIDSASERRSRPVVSRKMFSKLLCNRMLWCAYIGQYCVITLSYFFITWFPIYLVQARGMNIMHAAFATIVPAVAGFLGGIVGGYISDTLIRRGWSTSWARKTPFIAGMTVGCSLVLAAFTESNTAIVLLMTIAFFGKSVAAGAGTWAIVSDTAPREAVGLAGAVFNCIGNIGGIVTPIAFGYIVHGTGSYDVGLYFIAGHCLLAALVYLIGMGKIERVQMQ